MSRHKHPRSPVCRRIKLRIQPTQPSTQEMIEDGHSIIRSPAKTRASGSAGGNATYSEHRGVEAVHNSIIEHLNIFQFEQAPGPSKNKGHTTRRKMRCHATTFLPTTESDQAAALQHREAAKQQGPSRKTLRYVISRSKNTQTQSE